MFRMTFYTNRNNIEPMFFGVTFPVMIFFGWVGTIMALQSIRMGQFAYANSVINSISSVDFRLVFLTVSAFALYAFFSLEISCIAKIVNYFTLFRLAVFLVSFFTFIALFIFSVATGMYLSAFFGLLELFLVRFVAVFTKALKSIFCLSVFVVLRNWFNLLAMRATLCLNCLRHNQFLTNWLCLGPVSRPILVSGSFYYNKTTGRKSNEK